MHVILFEPEIPQNTGNIIRLSANTGCHLHLIKPFGFDLDNKKLKRAGLDYHEFSSIKTYTSFDDCVKQNTFTNLYSLTTKASASYSQYQYLFNDAFIFGPETRGLPMNIINTTKAIKIPMLNNSRSLNLSNSVAIMVYEAWRQLSFEKAAPSSPKLSK